MTQRFENYDLSGHNTFRMKASCACYIEYDSAKDLDTIDFDSLPQPLIHIGAGSNLLLTGDFPGTVLHSLVRYIKYVDMGMNEVPVMVGAGVAFDELVAQTCGHGLWGAENLSLIPGEVGAAAVQNIGAYGVEVKDIISGVVCYDTVERKAVKFKQHECGYGYRDSLFKRSGHRYIVTSVLFRFSRLPKPRLDYKGLLEALGGRIPNNPGEVRDAVIGIRRSKLPDPSEIGSAGSFFKNPVIGREQYSAFLTKVSKTGFEGIPPHFDNPDGSVKLNAAWLIDQCALKGAAEGGAAVYRKQPLVIVNATGNASARDVITLENRIINEVKDRYGIVLSPEVEHI